MKTLSILLLLALTANSCQKQKQSNHSITLTWKTSVTREGTPADVYYVYRSTHPGVCDEFNQPPAKPLAITLGTSYEDTNVQEGEKYYYAATAVILDKAKNEKRESSCSDEVSAQVLASNR